MVSPKMELRRPREDSPMKEGWHYGRYSTSAPIMPYYIFNTIKGVWAAIISGKEFRPVTKMHWFGPVPECVESKMEEENENNS